MVSIDKFTENEIISILDRTKQSFAVDTEGKVAELLGLGKSALSQQKSRNSLPVDKLVTACSRKGINVNWLLTGEGPMEVNITTSPATMTRNSRLPHEHGLLENAPSNVAPGPATLHRVPLISNVQAGAWTEIIDNLQPGDAEAWIDITSKVGPNAFALRVIGNSMEKEFWEGEMVIVDPAREPASGDYVVAKINHEEATFKQLIRDGGSIYLRPLNSAYPVIVVPPDKSFRIIGRVVEKVKRY
jgi:SOS-response transcriptional repressor LexA